MKADRWCTLLEVTNEVGVLLFSYVLPSKMWAKNKFKLHNQIFWDMICNWFVIDL